MSSSQQNIKLYDTIFKRLANLYPDNKDYQDIKNKIISKEQANDSSTPVKK